MVKVLKLGGIYNEISLNFLRLSEISAYIQLANQPAGLWKHSNTLKVML